MRIRSLDLQFLTGLALFALVCGCKCPPPENPEPAPPAEAIPEAGAETPAPAAEPAPAADPAATEPAADGAAPAEATPGAESLPAQGQPCTEDRRCADGLACMSYFGVAGRAGPEFHSCEIQCGEAAGACPDGQTCTTIADGPGPVCRPAPASR